MDSPARSHVIYDFHLPWLSPHPHSPNIGEPEFKGLGERDMSSASHSSNHLDPGSVRREGASPTRASVTKHCKPRDFTEGYYLPVLLAGTQGVSRTGSL